MVNGLKYDEIATLLNKDLKQIDNTIQRLKNKIRKILEDRKAEYGGDAKKAFSNLDENPIWLNKEKGIAIKRVTITGISNAIALHDKKDKDGNILNYESTYENIKPFCCEETKFYKDFCATCLLTNR